MENKDEIVNKKKANTLLVITIITFATLVIGAAYAYFKAVVDGPKSTPVKITAKTIDTLMLSIMDEQGDLQGTDNFTPLSIDLDQGNFTENDDDRIGVVKAKAELTPANEPSHRVTKNYYLNLIIEKNNFIYSTEEHKPEILLKITKPNGELLQNLPDGTELSTITRTGKIDLQGFDITTKTGVITIANNQEIIASTDTNGVPTPTTDEWKVELIFVNYDESQNKNAG